MPPAAATPGDNPAAEALERFRQQLIDSTFVVPKPKRAASKRSVAKSKQSDQANEVSFSFRNEIGKRTILSYKDGDNRPCLRINCGYKYLDRARGIFRIILHIALMKKFRTSAERKKLTGFFLAKAENNCVFYWADGAPKLHARTPPRRENSWQGDGQRRIGIGSIILNQQTQAIGVVGGFLKASSLPSSKSGPDIVHLLSAGHVFANREGADSYCNILHPHIGTDNQVIARVERYVAPQVNATIHADYGMASKYTDVDYSPYGLGPLGELLGHYTSDEMHTFEELLVALIERPSTGDFKTARIVGVIECIEFEIDDDTFAEVENILIVKWHSNRVPKKGSSGSLLVSVETKKAAGIIVGSKRASFDGTESLSYASMMDTIVSDSGLCLEVYA